ncbi:rod shape-determining protein MreC [Mesoflavibacter profundi]|uniref:Cell shape-determining protein MreC n=1 Tax=Mesoflavibacter profundi TaxID=2708110 RepID=A0ABT4S3H2_9FLAO|nr:rod shape-determining protein MreC [Mesoflavibacter profundi]MDA0178371.1 rod shape-determining protein MreC [Mesoflavibacter profundi]
MQQIVNFILRNKSFLFFLLLLFISVLFTIQSHSYHKSKFINSANFLTGGLYNVSHSISSYLNLREENKKLNEENARLKAIINSKKQTTSSYTDSLLYNSNYRFTPARIIKNSYSKQQNVLLINKGQNDSIKEDLAVIANNKIIGITDNYNSKYTTVISILNTTNRISAQLQKTNHFGTLKWDGKSPQIIQLTDIQKSAPLKVGDTVITSGRSAIFPKGILIGTVKDFHLDITENYYDVNINLFNDMTNLEHVIVIENKDKSLIEALLNNE